MLLLLLLLRFFVFFFFSIFQCYFRVAFHSISYSIWFVHLLVLYALFPLHFVSNQVYIHLFWKFICECFKCWMLNAKWINLKWELNRSTESEIDFFHWTLKRCNRLAVTEYLVWSWWMIWPVSDWQLPSVQRFFPRKPIELLLCDLCLWAWGWRMENNNIRWKEFN